MKSRNRLRALVLWLTTLVAACNAKNEPQPPPTGDVCSAATPICDPACQAGFECKWGNGACGCVAVQPKCIEDAPVCDPGCGQGFFCNTSCACQMDQPPPPADVLLRASRSTAVDISSDDSVVAMVNTDDGSVSFFNTTFGSESRSSKIATSNRSAASEPVSVVIHPNRHEAFVANRATGTVSRIVDINTTQPRLATELDVGSEVMGIALTPRGLKAYVTDWVNGNVLVVDTAGMRIDQTIHVGGSPFAVAISNDLDQDESDEKVLVSQYYARPRAGAAVVEGTDDGKEGLLHVIPVGAASPSKEIPLAPIADCFVGNAGNPPVEITSGCFPNQLSGLSIHNAFGKKRAYVVSTAASPVGPISFNHNVQALVSVIDLDTESEEPALTKNLNRLIKEQQVDTDMDESIGRRFMNAANAIDFVVREDRAIAYVSAAGSDIILRLQYKDDNTVGVGSTINFNITVGQNPQGLVVKHSEDQAGAFVANLISRDLSILSFRDQIEIKKVVSTDQPSDPSSAAFKVWKGKRFFNTSTGIWSKEGWGSCQGCHPMGLTDNVTWKFAAGPRQTISMDGQYASNDPTDMRALNWTAIFDETHDFENNTRGVSGGVGAIQNGQGPIVSAMTPNFVAILVEDGATVENHQGLNGSLKFVTRSSAICSNANTCPDWDLVDAYVQSIRSPRGAQASASSIEEGRRQFESGGCNKCHAGPKWTISRTFYSPEVSSGSLGSRVFEANRLFTTPMDATSLVGLPANVNVDQTLIAGDDSDMGAPAFKRQACNIRNVGTFGLADTAPETRENNSPAMGRNGFNPPSLLGLSLGAPFLHNGATRELNVLFSSAKYEAHTTAGSPNFAPSGAELDALVAFLRSIDESTQTYPIAANTVLCP